MYYNQPNIAAQRQAAAHAQQRQILAQQQAANQGVGNKIVDSLLNVSEDGVKIKVEPTLSLPFFLTSVALLIIVGLAVGFLNKQFWD